MKKIFIPFEQYIDSVGGPATFMFHLKRFLDDKGLEYSDGHKGIGAIFFPISYDIELLKKFKKKGGKIIQRLDGVYYPSKHGEEYIELNKDIKEIRNSLADIVVYQSEYSKAQCEAMLGELIDRETHIIINGTDKSVFYPSDHIKEELNEIRFITTGNFRNADMIEPVIKALDLLKSKYKFKIITIGQITNEKIKHFFDRPYVEIVDNLDQISLSDELRKADFFIYSHLNPPCPNSVIEAVSCGVPVVGFKSGAMEELLHFNKELLAGVSDEVFQKYEDFDASKLAEKIALAVKKFTHFKQRAKEHSYLYDFEETGKKYIEIFSKVLKAKWWDIFSTWGRGH